MKDKSKGWSVREKKETEKQKIQRKKKNMKVMTDEERKFKSRKMGFEEY